MYLDNDKGIVEQVEFWQCLDGGEPARMSMCQGKVLAREYQPSAIIPERCLGEACEQVYNV